MNTEKFYFSPRPVNNANQYVNNFFETLANRVNLINYNSRPEARSIEFLKYSLRSDIMILNWAEDTLYLKFGLWQTFLSCITFLLFRLKGGKIIWICHNKTTHKKGFTQLSKLIRKYYAIISNYIIVHSKDALTHFDKFGHKVYFLPHPVYEKTDIQACDSEMPIDVLIWGNIVPYKGLSQFIKDYKKYGKTFNVLIIGKADKKYLETLKEQSTGLNINIIDGFLEEDELSYYFNKCKTIVLPYLDKETFSSGALVHSLNSNKIVIGPNVGNFSDLSEKNACLAYNTQEELFTILTQLLEDKKYYDHILAKVRTGISRYYNSNSWEQFINNLLAILQKKSSLKPTPILNYN